MVESWGVGRGLEAQLRKVQIRSGLVAPVHRLRKAFLGVEAVEDHGVDEQDHYLDHDFNDRAQQTPVLDYISH